MIPNTDENPPRVWPFVTWALILTCISTYIWQSQHAGDAWGDLVLRYGFTPSNLMSPQVEPGEAPEISPSVSILTSMFLHGSWWHLAGNMLCLWFFGNVLEEGIGHVRFLVLYFLSGIAAALTFALIDPLWANPTVGASGAITGVIGSYLVLYPRAKVTIPIPLLLIVYQFRVSPFWLLGLWFAMQLLALTGPDTTSIAWWAHLGGFVAGLVLTPFLKAPGAPFFGPRPPRDI